MSKKMFQDLNDIPVEGSLGLLALGAVGLMAWRKKRQAVGYFITNSNFIKEQPQKIKKNKNKNHE